MEREWDAEGSRNGVDHFVTYSFLGITSTCYVNKGNHKRNAFAPFFMPLISENNGFRLTKKKEVLCI